MTRDSRFRCGLRFLLPVVFAVLLGPASARAREAFPDPARLSSGEQKVAIASAVVHGLAMVLPSAVLATFNGKEVLAHRRPSTGARVAAHVFGWASVGGSAALLAWGARNPKSAWGGTFLAMGAVGLAAGATAVGFAIAGALQPEGAASPPVALFGYPRAGGGVVGLAATF